MMVRSVGLAFFVLLHGCSASSGSDADTNDDTSERSDTTSEASDPSDPSGGDEGAACSFNSDCAASLRCACDGECACEAGPRGTGKNGIDACVDGNDCESSVCVEDAAAGYTCSGQCETDGDCEPALPLCTDISFVGRICIRSGPA